MFMGGFEHTLDNKGRIIIPAKFREELGDSFVITRGLDNCLFVYPMNEWRILESKLKALPLTKADARRFVRFLFSGATECSLDKQGRVNLPANLCDYAKLEKDVVIVGVSNRIEMWSKQLWEDYLQDAAESYEEIAEEIVDLGI